MPRAKPSFIRHGYFAESIWSYADTILFGIAGSVT